tara:strand:- start:612 stop:923 length:312 start_codon:yes stop_codon:yes gene_type:complete
MALRYTDRVNELLTENAGIWANLGTSSKKDLKTKEAADARWQEILNEIKTLDLELWRTLIIDEVSDFDEPTFIDIDRLAIAEEKLKDITICSRDDDECLSCGA